MPTYRQQLKNEAATLRFGQALARASFQDETQKTPPPGVGVASLGGVIHLHGELGAGKTTLSRGILRGYGHVGAVKSPTYTLVEPYEFEQCNIYHFDLYRLADPEEVAYLGTDDYFAENNLCIVEWAQLGGTLIAPADLQIHLLPEGKGRLLECEPISAKGAQIAKRLWASGRKL